MAKTESRKITMNDGRVVEFGEKQRMDKSYGVTPDGLVFVQIDFDNNETISMEVDPASKLGHDAMGHGLSQKLGDGGAGAENTADAFEAILEIAARLARGEWRKTSEAGAGGTAKGSSELIEALMAVTNRTKEVAREMLSKLDAADKRALRITPAISAAIKVIQAGRAPSKAATEKAAAAEAQLAAMMRGEMPTSATPAQTTDEADSEPAPE